MYQGGHSTGAESQFFYDGLHRRVWAWDAQTDTEHYYYHNLNWQLLEDRKKEDEQTRTYKQYVWDIRYIDSPVLRWCDYDGDGDFTDPNEVLYFTNDGNFNVTALVNPGGNVVERYVYDPYGQVTVLNGAADADPNVAEWTADPNGSDWDNTILYCGYHLDCRTRLYHVRFRYLQPGLGRWLRRNPKDYRDGMALYGYCMGMPTGRVDPMGLDVIPPGGQEPPAPPDPADPDTWRGKRDIPWDWSHVGPKCTGDDDCETALAKAARLERGAAIRKARLLDHVGNLKEKDPTSYNNHIKELRRWNAHIIRCNEVIMCKCPDDKKKKFKEQEAPERLPVVDRHPIRRNVPLPGQGGPGSPEQVPWWNYLPEVYWLQHPDEISPSDAARLKDTATFGGFVVVGAGIAYYRARIAESIGKVVSTVGGGVVIFVPSFMIPGAAERELERERGGWGAGRA